MRVKWYPSGNPLSSAIVQEPVILVAKEGVRPSSGIAPPAIHFQYGARSPRRNWQRYQSERGGKAVAILPSLIASCRRHKKNPFEYLRDVLRRIATYPVRRILDLTPGRWKPRPNTS
jgi:hypothetical protein